MWKEGKIYLLHKFKQIFLEIISDTESMLQSEKMSKLNGHIQAHLIFIVFMVNTVVEKSEAKYIKCKQNRQLGYYNKRQ